MLSIEPLREAHYPQLEQLGVTAQQLEFVGSLDEILGMLSDTVHPHVVVHKDQVVGFFLLDICYWYEHAFCPKNGLGLRAYFIAQQFQGLGYGAQALDELVNYARYAYKRKSAVYLTVNCRNDLAKACYLKSGFVDTDELYMGGSIGPQHIMRRSIE